VSLKSFFFFRDHLHLVFDLLVEDHKISDLTINLFKVFFEVLLETLPHGIIISFVLAVLRKFERMSLKSLTQVIDLDESFAHADVDLAVLHSVGFCVVEKVYYDSRGPVCGLLDFYFFGLFLLSFQ